MMPAAASTPAQTGWISRARATVSRTVAAVSKSSRSSRSRLTWRGRSATTAASARAPPRPSRTSVSTRARDTELSAASAAANTPASGISRTARTIRATGFIYRVGSGLFEPDGAEQAGVVAALGLAGGGRAGGRLPLREQAVLQAEHLTLLLGLAVVVAQQMQDAVDGEQVQLVGEAVARLARLRRGERRAEDDVAEQCRADLRGVRAPRLVDQLVHRERHDVGGPRLVHPALV